MSHRMVGRWSATALSFALAIGGVSCGTSEPSAPPLPKATEIRVVPTEVSLVQGEFRVLQAAALDAHGAFIEHAAISYVSHDEAMATVNLDGAIHAGTKTGTTTITVSALGVSREVPVTVRQKIASVDLTPRFSTLKQLDSAQLVVRVLDVVGQPVAGAQFA